jgi:PadR family transcriptional regulator, regulatory protein PadR
MFAWAAIGRVTTRQRIVDYLTARSGYVEASDGRGLVADIARAAGLNLGAVTSMLARLDREGVITRTVRGRRTFRIALAKGDNSSARTAAVARSARPVSVPDCPEDELCHPRGHLKVCLLLLLASRPDHGYELVERLRAFGYEHDGPPPVYRALHWLDDAGLIQPSWETSGPGPARRVYGLSPEGRRVVERCATILGERTSALQRRLAQALRATGAAERCFRVTVEAKLSVHATDEQAARQAVEKALGRGHMISQDVRGTGEASIYQAAGP